MGSLFTKDFNVKKYSAELDVADALASKLRAEGRIDDKALLYSAILVLSAHEAEMFRIVWQEEHRLDLHLPSFFNSRAEAYKKVLPKGGFFRRRLVLQREEESARRAFEDVRAMRCGVTQLADASVRALLERLSTVFVELVRERRSAVARSDGDALDELVEGEAA